MAGHVKVVFCGPAAWDLCGNQSLWKEAHERIRRGSYSYILLGYCIYILVYSIVRELFNSILFSDEDSRRLLNVISLLHFSLRHCTTFQNSSSQPSPRINSQPGSQSPGYGFYGGFRMMIN